MLVLISLSVLIEYTLFAEELKCFIYKLNVCPQTTLLCKNFLTLSTVQCYFFQMLSLWRFASTFVTFLYSFMCWKRLRLTVQKSLPQSTDITRLLCYQPFIWNLHFNVVLHLMFSGILMSNISPSCSSDLTLKLPRVRSKFKTKFYLIFFSKR